MSFVYCIAASALMGAIVLVISLIVIAPTKKDKGADLFMSDEERIKFESERKKQKLKDEAGFKALSYFQKKEQMLDQSDVGITFDMYLAITAALSIFGFVLFQYMFGKMVISLGGALIAGFILPDMIVKKRLEKRQEAFDSHLHEALRRMASSMRAGSSVQLAAEEIAKSNSIPSDVRTEFKKIIIELGYGETIDTAFRHMYERIGSNNLKFLSITIKEQVANGGNMAEMFENIGNTINNKRIMDQSIKATLSQGKTSAVFLSCIPFLLPLIMRLVSPGYFDPMTNTPLGQLIFFGSYGVVAVGMVVLNKMTDIDT